MRRLERRIEENGERVDTLKVALPMETGVIDLVGFMRALWEMGYDGPVMPEPFSQRASTT
jgi:sugar phosphate isomerase/epimerase